MGTLVPHAHPARALVDMAEFEVTPEEVEEQMAEAESMGEETQYPGMTYEQGVRDALRWILGDEDLPPI